jgi:hypothetical protein
MHEARPGLGDAETHPLVAKSALAMTEFCPSNAPPQLAPAARCSGIRDKVLVGLVLFTLVRTGEALAGDQTSIGNAALNADADGLRRSSPPVRALIALPQVFAAPAAAESQAFSATEFRPRKRTIFDRDPLVNSFGDSPMLRGTTVWQRMSEYRSHDGVRLLTLWESSASTVSLQAGKRGDPSLQWTSRSMTHGGPTRGLLDRLFSVSLAGARNRLRAMPPASAAATPSPANAPVVASVN